MYVSYHRGNYPVNDLNVNILMKLAVFAENKCMSPYTDGEDRGYFIPDAVIKSWFINNLNAAIHSCSDEGTCQIDLSKIRADEKATEWINKVPRGEIWTA
jgi:hypothetical protein